MRALVLAAGLGTRLKPWTNFHPKALVKVGGITMLERVLSKLEDEGFDKIAVNIHHFGEQIIDFLSGRLSKAEIIISDERSCLLDTGGGILQADELLSGSDPLLIHNVDILSNAPLYDLMNKISAAGSDAILLTSDRESSRKLATDKNGRLCGWIDMRTGATRPSEKADLIAQCHKVAFSGIYALSKDAINDMKNWSTQRSFPIMDYLLANCHRMNFQTYNMPELKIIDIGKPETLRLAEAQMST